MENENIVTFSQYINQGGNQVTNKIIIAVAGDDMIVDYADYGLSFDSSESDVLSALKPSIQEKFDVNIQDTNGSWLYKTRKAQESQNIYLIPNSTAGDGEIEYDACGRFATLSCIRAIG